MVFQSKRFYVLARIQNHGETALLGLANEVDLRVEYKPLEELVLEHAIEEANRSDITRRV